MFKRQFRLNKKKLNYSVRNPKQFLFAHMIIRTYLSYLLKNYDFLFSFQTRYHNVFEWLQAAKVLLIVK